MEKTLGNSLMASSSHDTALGIHYIVECKGGKEITLTDPKAVLDTLINCAKTAGATVIDSIIHQFSPYGLSGVVVIAESHITIHTWPEHQYSAIDIFTCGEDNIAQKIYEEIIEAFAPTTHSVKKITRGVPSCYSSV